MPTVPVSAAPCCFLRLSTCITGSRVAVLHNRRRREQESLASSCVMGARLQAGGKADLGVRELEAASLDVAHHGLPFEGFVAEVREGLRHNGRGAGVSAPVARCGGVHIAVVGVELLVPALHEGLGAEVAQLARRIVVLPGGGGGGMPMAVRHNRPAVLQGGGVPQRRHIKP